MYQTKPTEKVATAEERFVDINLDVVYKVVVLAMLAYIVARMNKLV